MKFDRLKLKNFRQYYGDQSLEFSQNEENNVTVIHGDNGSGKTTILNAFLWLFYDEVNLPKGDWLANERAMAEAGIGDTVEVEVQLEFDHEKNHYIATRRAGYKKADENDLQGDLIETDLTVYYIPTSGERKKRGDPETVLQQIMPARLKDLFFFDGETISELSEQGDQETIQDAIQDIMGLTVLERGIRHLDDVEGRFEDRIEEHGSDELRELINEKKEKKEAIEEKEEEKEMKIEEKERIDDRVEEIEERLGDLEETQELQEERDELNDDLQEKQEEISEINDEMKSTISEWGFLVFGMDAVEKTAEELEEKRKKGEIPTDIKQQFVDDLLERGECICGRPLEEGTTEHKTVEDWRERAGSHDMDQVAITITSRLSRMMDKRRELFKEIEEKMDIRADKEDEIDEINQRLSEISEKISEKDTEEASELEDEKNELENESKDLGYDIRRLGDEIEEAEEDIEDIEDEIEEAEEEKEKANTARRRKKAARESKKVLQSLFDQKQDEVRDEVNDEVNEIFTSIIEKDYYAEIDEDFSLNILKDIRGGGREPVPVKQSRGERQVASLSFIASLVSLAKKNYESDGEIGDFEGGIYPIVMDSPFGALGETYRERVSSTMPEMSDRKSVV